MNPGNWFDPSAEQPVTADPATPGAPSSTRGGAASNSASGNLGSSMPWVTSAPRDDRARQAQLPGLDIMEKLEDAENLGDARGPAAAFPDDDEYDGGSLTGPFDPIEKPKCAPSASRACPEALMACSL